MTEFYLGIIGPVHLSYPLRFARVEGLADGRGSIDLLRISLAEEHCGSRIPGEQSADEGMQHGLRLTGESRPHLGGRALHPRDDSGVAELGDVAAEVALAEVLRPVVLAEEQAVFQRREEGHAEFVRVDVGLQAG